MTLFTKCSFEITTTEPFPFQMLNLPFASVRVLRSSLVKHLFSRIPIGTEVLR